MKRFAGVFLEIERRGLLPEPLDPERKARFEEAMRQPDPPMTHIIDVSSRVDSKRAAAGMHKSQFGESSIFARIPEELRAGFYGEERFFQAYPPAEPGDEPERGDVTSLLPPDLV
jgi:LmbE family N-acetylglucosaminyl deacetylase